MKFTLLLFITLVLFTNQIKAQHFSAEDLAKSKEIDATVIELLSKASNNFEGMRGKEVAKAETYMMYEATATPKMYAQNYYITYTNANRRNFYMAYYTTPHEIDLAIASIMGMPEYGGDAWTIKKEVTDDKNINKAFLYYNGAKVGMLREDKEAKAFSFSIGLYDNMLTLSPTPASTTTKQVQNIASSNHLTINGNILTVKNWGPKFDGDYDLTKLATDSCVSGNCVDGDGRKILVNITNNIPSIRIMEGRFKHDVFLGHGVMLVDGEGPWYDGTYEMGKYKADYTHNDLYAKATFRPKDLNETVEGHFNGYLDDGIGSALSQYRKFVVCRFRPLYESKNITVWEKNIYPAERDAELKAIYASAEYKEARAKIEARESVYRSNPAPTSTNQSKAERIKTTCYECHGSGKTFRTEYSYYEQYGKQYRKETKVYSSCYKCHGTGKD